jgi:hypothetical protein
MPAKGVRETKGMRESGSREKQFSAPGELDLLASWAPVSPGTNE